MTNIYFYDSPQTADVEREPVLGEEPLGANPPGGDLVETIGPPDGLRLVDFVTTYLKKIIK